METAFKAIIEGLGVGGALFVIACLVIGYLFKQNADLHKQSSELSERCQKDRDALQEKRLEEAKQLLVIIERNNQNSAEVMKSVQAVTATQNELIKGFASMAQASELSRERFSGQATRMEETIKTHTAEVNRLHQAVTSLNGRLPA